MLASEKHKGFHVQDQDREQGLSGNEGLANEWEPRAAPEFPELPTQDSCPA